MPPRLILIEGLTPDQVLALPDDDLYTLILCGEPLLFHIGSAEILARFSRDSTSLYLELAHVSGGGEGALPTLAALAFRYARSRGLLHLDWRVHAIACTKPNPKLRRVLVSRGFRIRHVTGVGDCYHLVQSVHPSPAPSPRGLFDVAPVNVYDAPPPEIPAHSATMSYYPALSTLLPNGHLRMHTAGIAKTGERWNGSKDIGPDHPHYAVWKALIEARRSTRDRS